MSESRIRSFAAAAAVMLAMPAVSAKLPEAKKPLNHTVTDEPAAQQTAYYKVLRTETGTVEQISVRDYLIGAVGAEVPASYEPEALKAQAIAAHTYAERIRLGNRKNPDAALKGADFSDDSRSYQAFYSEDQLRDFYGSRFAESYEKIAAAVDAAGDQLLYYADEPIVAAFHAVSAGQTESAEAVWGTNLPYLVSVSSGDDRNAPQYETVQGIQPETVRQALRTLKPETVFPDDPSEWFGEPSCSEAGTVLQISCGSEQFTGQQIKDSLSLRSACFSVKYDDMQFVFNVCGYGHAVGMSQYGANEMAKRGCSCEEILMHYYPGTKLVQSGSRFRGDESSDKDAAPDP